VDDKIRFRRAIIELDDFEVLITNPYSAVTPFPKYERLPVLDLDHPIFLDVAPNEHFKGCIVEDVAVLVYLYERNTLVPHRSLDDHLEMFGMPVNGPGDECSLGSNCNREGIQRVVDHSEWSGFGLLAEFGRR